MKLLIIEDEQGLRESIEKYFTEAGVLCESCGTLAAAIGKISLYQYDCVLLDIGLPDGEGFALLEYLQANEKSEGVLIISAKNSLDNKIKGLNLGADDYLTKPFHLSELKARIDAIYRRRAFNSSNVLNYDLINIDLLAREVKVNDITIILTRKEYDMLLYFIANKGKVISKNAIAEHLWGEEIDLVDSFDFIYTHIKNIRKKLMEAAHKDYIKAIYGVGYKLL
ncbi:response regulator transcription factor [Mucilaginibacter sp. UR6-11]|uniref:response regulator transcription factor n=1 Tax=Mucilaginibacter sp. UR6-11 TaxID=1435644 RepID=UPI001E307339|nr:response regulator transcription factor [Mucilaginibacter sp. UR6-11]MCC8423810.1 response regulator transcription factor [Mucilaginibacter sp. UR6-11]